MRVVYCKKSRSLNLNPLADWLSLLDWRVNYAENELDRSVHWRAEGFVLKLEEISDQTRRIFLQICNWGF